MGELYWESGERDAVRTVVHVGGTLLAAGGGGDAGEAVAAAGKDCFSAGLCTGFGGGHGGWGRSTWMGEGVEVAAAVCCHRA